VAGPRRGKETRRAGGIFSYRGIERHRDIVAELTCGKRAKESENRDGVCKNWKMGR
jgi:hypothetical protein